METVNRPMKFQYFFNNKVNIPIYSYIPKKLLESPFIVSTLKTELLESKTTIIMAGFNI